MRLYKVSDYTSIQMVISVRLCVMNHYNASSELFHMLLVDLYVRILAAETCIDTGSPVVYNSD